MMGDMISSLSQTENVEKAEDYLIPNDEKIKIVIISDTHNWHREMTIPDGDILIHGGDFTNFGDIEHAVDFNEWLATLPHKHKIVVNGNHESNSAWKNEASEVISNATFLINQTIVVNCKERNLKIFGSQFYWPMKYDRNPNWDVIEKDTNIIIAHGPVLGFVDDGKGCPDLLKKIEDLKLSFFGFKKKIITENTENNSKNSNNNSNNSNEKHEKNENSNSSNNSSNNNLLSDGLRLVIGGHMHSAYGTASSPRFPEVLFVNGSNCGQNRMIKNPPIVCYI